VKRKFRLIRSTDFQRVRRFGKSYAHPLIVLVGLENKTEDHPRLGVAAGRSVGNAVHRNRAKRLMRAALQPFLPKISPGWDILLLARKPMRDATYQSTQAAVLQLLRRAHLIEEAAHDE
jgi:ribonuclease P protein component